MGVQKPSGGDRTKTVVDGERARALAPQGTSRGEVQGFIPEAQSAQQVRSRESQFQFRDHLLKERSKR